MGFRFNDDDSSNFTNPKEMYKDYKNRTIDGLLDYQTEIITEYMKKYDKRDIALELPTGSGKTLVGLVIGEYRRRKNKEKIVYICPNNQLVYQVAEQAKKKYGINVRTFTGKFDEYDKNAKTEYITSKAIAVTNYSSFFNDKTIFYDADILIFDDVHSAEDYIAAYWCVNIDRDDNSVLYKVLTEYFKDSIDSVQYNRMINDNIIDRDKDWIDKVPNINMVDLLDNITSILEEHVKGTNLIYSWINIKNIFHACNVFLSWRKITIRPLIPPTLNYEPFKNAKQRIYMSATLGISGELERIIGVKSIERLPIVNEWNNKGLGRRFFLFPEVSFDNEKTKEFFIKANNLVDRSIFLVPDNNRVEKTIEFVKEKTNKEIFKIKDIEISKEVFVNSNDGMAILANRFDGIDFPENECRMLNINGLPFQTHLQEKFFTTRMAASILFKERIKTRIIQAVGRCTRKDVDYSLVIVLDEKFQNELITKSKLREYHPELQAEVTFGLEQSENQESVDELIDLIKLFFEHGEEWAKAERRIVNIRDNIIKERVNLSTNSEFEKLLKSSKYEVEFQYALIKKDYEYALKKCQSIIDILQSNELKGYKGFWNYMAGYITYLIYHENGEELYLDKSRIYMREASKSTNSITWFNKLVQKVDKQTTEYEDYVADIIERIESIIIKDGTSNSNKFEKKVCEILSLLGSKDGKKFEDGHTKLGELLGYISDNANGDGEPDPWWIINENICIVSEDKIYKKDDKAIPVNHVKQASGHEIWIKEREKRLTNGALILTVMITNSKKIEENAAIYGKDIWYVNKDEFIEWAIKSIEAIRKLRIIFTDEGNLIWREKAKEILRNAGATPGDLLRLIQKIKLNQVDKA